MSLPNGLHYRHNGSLVRARDLNPTHPRIAVDYVRRYSPGATRIGRHTYMPVRDAQRVLDGIQRHTTKNQELRSTLEELAVGYPVRRPNVFVRAWRALTSRPVHF